MGQAELLVLRYSVQVAAPGCAVLVLESLSRRSPYVLENRTPHPLYFRQVSTPALAYQKLPPHSAAGFVWRTTSEATQKVLHLRLHMQHGTNWAIVSGVSAKV